MEQFDGRPHKKSDNYSLAKLAVLLLFKWNVAWNILAWPISKMDYQKAPKHQILDFLSQMLQVSRLKGYTTACQSYFLLYILNGTPTFYTVYNQKTVEKSTRFFWNITSIIQFVSVIAAPEILNC